MASVHHNNKIVFLTENSFGSSLGGLEQHMFYLAQELTKQGSDVTILALRVGRTSAETKRFIPVGNRHFTVEEYVRFNPLFLITSFLERRVSGKAGFVPALIEKLLPNVHLRVLTRRVAEINPDLVHQHDYFSNILASKLLARRWPVVFTNHTGQYLFLEKSAPTRKLQRFLLRHFCAIIGPSEELTPVNERSVFIPNGVDVDFFDGLRTEPNDRLVVICPRRWAPTKGVRYLAEAMTLLSPEQQQRLLVLFAGSDSNDYPWYAEEVQGILSTLPADMYELLGNLDQAQLRDQYLRSDVVAIPSLMEATSLAAMEGMACGLPVLSTNVGGMPDVVVNDSVGWLVEPADSRAIRDTLVEILTNRSMLGAMSVAARDFVRTSRSWRQIADRTVAVYERVLDVGKVGDRNALD